jgi:hypothetical protein
MIERLFDETGGLKVPDLQRCEAASTHLQVVVGSSLVAMKAPAHCGDDHRGSTMWIENERDVNPISNL